MHDQLPTAVALPTAGAKAAAPPAARARRIAVWVGAVTAACLVTSVAASRAFPLAVPAVWGERAFRSALSWPVAAAAPPSPPSGSVTAAATSTPVGGAAADGSGASIDEDGDEGGGGGGGDGSDEGGAAALPPPPPLAASFRLPLDAAPPADEPFDVPRTIAALALPRLPSSPPSAATTNRSVPSPPSRPPSETAIALYVQSSFRKYKASPIHLRVTHCVIGNVAVPLSRQYQAVWVCVVDAAVTARLRRGDPLTVLVDEDEPLRRGNWTALEEMLRRGVTRKERIPLAGGGVTRGFAVTTSVRWGETLNPDPPAAAAAATAAAAAAAVAEPGPGTRDDGHDGDNVRDRVRGGGAPLTPPPNSAVNPLATGVHRVCAMMQSLYEPATAVAWMDYHARLGVDRLFLYSNVANSTAVVAAVAASPVSNAIEVVHWPWRRSQLTAGHHFLAAARGRCRWVLLFDVDEWMLVREAALPPRPPPPPPSSRRHRRGGGGGGGGGAEEPPLPPLLRALAALNASTGATAFKVPSVRMGSAGRVKDPHRPYPEVYTYRVEANAPWKPIALTANTFPLTQVHTVSLRDPRARMTLVPGAVLPQPSPHAAAATNATQPPTATNATSPPAAADAAAAAAAAPADGAEVPLAPLVMVHYGFRSWEEEVHKRDAGRSSEEVTDYNGGRRVVTNPDDPALADRRAAHISLDGQIPWMEMRDAWRAVLRRPWRPPVVVAAAEDAGQLTDWVDAPSIVPR